MGGGEREETKRGSIGGGEEGFFLDCSLISTGAIRSEQFPY